MDLYKIFENCAGRISSEVFLYASKGFMMPTMKQYKVSIVSEGEGTILGKNIARVSFPDDAAVLNARMDGAQVVDMRVLKEQSRQIFSGMLAQHHLFLIQDRGRPLMVVESLLFRKPIGLIPLHEQGVRNLTGQSFEKV
ncbi:MAG: hypothetical protein RBR86_03220 [Pseudobdellovibrionaceae bacterium]|jgi:hypothetical protein|nr:hypothetical protein [Pseudobdellovibrionaceae bacterium]